VKKRGAQIVVLGTALLVVAVCRAAAPVGRFTIAGDIVTDEVTGLRWQRVVPTGTSDWAEAKAYCENLTLAGMTGWRLPTKKELESIVDWRVEPAVDSTAFPGTRGDFWSSTSVAGDSSLAWVVGFTYGSSTTENIGVWMNKRCVL